MLRLRIQLPKRLTYFLHRLKHNALTIVEAFEATMLTPIICPICEQEIFEQDLRDEIKFKLGRIAVLNNKFCHKKCLMGYVES